MLKPVEREKPERARTSPKFQNVVLERVEVRPLSQPRLGMEDEYNVPTGVMDHVLLREVTKVEDGGRAWIGPPMVRCELLC